MVARDGIEPPTPAFSGLASIIIDDDANNLCRAEDSSLVRNAIIIRFNELRLRNLLVVDRVGAGKSRVLKEVSTGAFPLLLSAIVSHRCPSFSMSYDQKHFRHGGGRRCLSKCLTDLSNGIWL